MLASVRRWFQRVGRDVAFNAIGTTVTTALLLWTVWAWASEHMPFAAAWAAMLAAVVSGRNWYFIGKLRGLRETRAIWDEREQRTNERVVRETLGRVQR